MCRNLYKLELAYRIKYYKNSSEDRKYSIALHKNYFKLMDTRIDFTSSIGILKKIQLSRYVKGLGADKYLGEEIVFKVYRAELCLGYAYFDGLKFDFYKEKLDSEGYKCRQYITSFGIPRKHRSRSKRVKDYILYMLMLYHHKELVT